jgi:2-polyprenyl-6-methoxyphenol hydroxylase-like FAD-dependent oxidoreductase
MRVMVVGGGIGGTVAALSLAAAGIEACLYESVPDVRPLGLGINLQPNAVCELIELGLGDALAATAIETANYAFYNKHGQRIWAEPRGIAAGYRWPQYSIHRGALQALLLEAAVARLGRTNVRLGWHLASFEQDAAGVTAQFVDRASGRALAPETADALIGADGVNSAVRRQFYPGEQTSWENGLVQWRGAVEAASFLDGRTQVIIGHRTQRAVLYPMSHEAAARGRSLINWVIVLDQQWHLDRRENWDRRVPKERFFARFANWNFDWIAVADLIAATPEIFEYPSVDHDPLPRWSFGRVTLLGDAAHPMRPVGSQAGSQAVVDGRVLARALADHGDVVQALAAYEADRLPRMNDVLLRNRQDGPEIVMHMAEERAPGGFADIEDVIPRRELEAIAHSFKLAAGFEPEQLNTRPSLDAAPERRST